jgi:hypothetical protein
MQRLIGLLLLAAAVAAAACGPSGSGGESPSPSIGPGASPGPDLGFAELRYRLIDQLGRPAFCDPDSYPVGRDEVQAMRERFPEVERDPETLVAIRARLGIAAAGDLTDDQRLAIYREWKLLNAIVLEGPERGFNLLVRLDEATGTGVRVAGTIGADGTITVTSQEPGARLECPICLASGTRIATPGGSVAIEDLRPGELVWSLDGRGRRIVATVLQAGRAPVPPDHAVVRLELADGRVVRASPGHPLIDGRALGSLRAGDVVDGATVVGVHAEAYAGGFTYDLLASGPTGAYLADGIPLDSTLTR